MVRYLLKIFALIILLYPFPTEVMAMNSIGFTVGKGEESTTRVRISFQRDWSTRWFADKAWNLGGYWEAGIGFWDGDKGSTGNDSLVAASIIPVFRLQPKWSPSNTIRPYVDAAVGFYLLSASTIGDKNMSTSFQFGDHIGIGLHFGKKERFEIGYRFEHISNASIKTPNPGINFHLLRLVYLF